jgi:hypothetical protein
VRPQAERVFPIFPPGRTSNVVQVKQAGRLWLTFNADAYSNYTVDNSGLVTVIVAADTRWLQCPDVGVVCKAPLPTLFKAVCVVANAFVGGCGGGAIAR